MEYREIADAALGAPVQIVAVEQIACIVQLEGVRLKQPS